jgi:hypothetical protein
MMEERAIVATIAVFSICKNFCIVFFVAKKLVGKKPDEFYYDNLPKLQHATQATPAEARRSLRRFRIDTQSCPDT